MSCCWTPQRHVVGQCKKTGCWIVVLVTIQQPSPKEWTLSSLFTSVENRQSPRHGRHRSWGAFKVNFGKWTRMWQAGSYFSLVKSGRKCALRSLFCNVYARSGQKLCSVQQGSIYEKLVHDSASHPWTEEDGSFTQWRSKVELVHFCLWKTLWSFHVP